MPPHHIRQGSAATAAHNGTSDPGQFFSFSSSRAELETSSAHQRAMTGLKRGGSIAEPAVEMCPESGTFGPDQGSRSSESRPPLKPD
jgi:hypothetical protein